MSENDKKQSWQTFEITMSARVSGLMPVMTNLEQAKIMDKIASQMEIVLNSNNHLLSYSVRVLVTQKTD